MSTDSTDQDTQVFADGSKDTELQHKLRNLWHDNFNEQEFIEEAEALVLEEVRRVLDRLDATARTADNCTDDTYVVKTKFIQAERQRLDQLTHSKGEKE